jgi:cytochrome c oxidase cbb3-type subunit 4
MADMSHETVVGIVQMIALLSMIALFIGVVIYVFRPGNSARFDRAKRSILKNRKNEPRDDE